MSSRFQAGGGGGTDALGACSEFDRADVTRAPATARKPTETANASVDLSDAADVLGSTIMSAEAATDPQAAAQAARESDMAGGAQRATELNKKSRQKWIPMQPKSVRS
mmetsp:Transcript_22807/g.60084  ORF Transcript_22807/g.60084 Transcript_22807/m.60084 type:complete len:108 (-) Transcript_22807:3-326(-)